VRLFLEAKYFRHFSPATFAQIFKSLWRVTFKAIDARCETNRTINAQALEVVFEFRKAELTELIKSERDWFSDVSFLDGPIAVLTRFFRENPQVFPLLNDALKTPIQNFANLSLDHFATCWFISPSLDAHVSAILDRIGNGEDLSPEIFKGFCVSLSTTDVFRIALNIGIELYRMSKSYDTADKRFDEMIRPFVTFYSREQIQRFLGACEICIGGQATSRRRAWSDHLEIKAIIDSKFPDITLDDYSAFKRSIGL